VRFWDASAVVPLLVSEPTTEGLVDLLERDPLMLVWWGTAVECTSAVARQEREGALAAAGSAASLNRLRGMAAGWQEVLPADAVRSTAQRLLRVHPLRAADALQLAAAIIACEHEPSSLELVCLDERLSEAARREGFEVVGPVDVPPPQ
jgi:predicted nucleic acid-binding protein